MANPVRVNTTTADQQYDAAIAALSTGGYVIVWDNNDPARQDVFGQRFDAAGSPVGGEFQINTTTSGAQFAPTVSALTSGGFVAVWQSGEGANADIYARRYDSAGNAVGQDFLVNSATANEQLDARVTALDGGGFLVSWDTRVNGTFQDVQGQLYNAGGSPAGTAFVLNTTTADQQGISALAPLNGGGFVAIWQSVTPSGGNNNEIVGQRFDSAGAKVGVEFQVNTSTVGTQNGDDVARLSNGNFVVTWVDLGTDRIVGRIYSSTGTALTGELTIASASGTITGVTTVTALANGAFLASWVEGNDTANTVLARSFDSSGAALGATFNVSTNATDFPVQTSDGVVMLTNGTVAFAWDGPTASDDQDIYMRLLTGVPGANTAPVATADKATTAEDVAVTISVLANDSDINSDTLSITSATGATHGSTKVNGDGTVTYSPDANYNGTDSFTYNISDGKGGTSSATVTLTVTPVNDAPVADADGPYAATEDTKLTVTAANGVLTGDTDVDGDALTAQLVSTTTHGTLVLNSDGSFNYTPTANYNGADSFSYKAKDGTGALSATQTVTINVAAVNDAPDAVNDIGFATSFQTALVTPVATLLANDIDVDGNTLSVTSVQGATNGTVSLNAGQVTFTPSAGYSGAASYTYTISDGSLSDTATVSLTVGAKVNNAPVADADGPYAATEDTKLTVTAGNGVLNGDTDVDGDPLTAELVSTTTKGTLTFAADGSFSYTPNADFNGTDSFSYRAKDSNGAVSTTQTVTINVAAVNDAPIADADGPYAATEDTKLTVTAANGVLNGDTDVDGDPLTAELVSNTTKGTLTFAADGSFSYTPNVDFNGTDSFSYKAKDNSGAVSATQTVTINVTAVNDAPDAVDDSGFATLFQTALLTPVATLLANDTDVEGNPLSIISVQNATNGTVSLSGGNVTFTPNAGYSGAASYTYTISDGSLTDTATVSLTVGTKSNSAPVADADGPYTATEDMTLTVTTANGVLDGDTDVDGDPLTAELVSTTTKGTLAFAADGSFSFTPNADFNGTDSFSYKAKDSSGAVSATQAVTINVAAVNDAPMVSVASQSVTTAEDTAKSIKVTATDVDGDALTYTATGAAKGVVSGGSGGLFTYMPNADVHGTDSFIVTVSDGNGGTATQTVNVDITPDNQVATVAAIAQFRQGTLPSSLGGIFDVFGDTSAQTLTISDGSDISFRSGFNSGARDYVTITGQAQNFVISQVLGNVTLTSATDAIALHIPLGTNGMTLTFDNGDSRVLSINGNAVLLGTQNVSATPTAVTQGPGVYIPPPESNALPVAAIAQFKQGTVPSSLGGTFDVFGDTSAQILTLLDNSNINFRSGFNSGARDSVAVTGPAQNFVISQVLGNVTLASATDAITLHIPVGTNGMNIIFDNGDSRALSLDGNAVLLGTDIISATPTAVSGTGPLAGLDPQPFYAVI